MMKRAWRRWVVLAVLVTFGASANAKEEQVEFKVVPNKGGEVSVALDTPPMESSTCRFKWDSTGATVEVSCNFQWFREWGGR